MTTIPAPGADLATEELPKLPAPFGCIDIYENSGIVRSVDGFTADQVRGYAIDYAMQLGRATLAAVPASEPDRFFMDHGLWHDRVTGQHMYTQDQYDEESRACLAEGKENAMLAAAPAPVSGMPDLASLQRYRPTVDQHHAEFSPGPMEQHARGDYVRFAEARALLNPAGETK